MDKKEVNQFGNEVIRSFEGNTNRYKFDCGLCSYKKGWIQFDTDQDAYYFGVWIHKGKKQIVTYAEGDLIIVEAPTSESFNEEIAHMCKYYGGASSIRTIDADGIYTRYYQDRKECFIEMTK